MPIGSGIVYNTGDLILSQVSSSGTAFLETKIAAATSSLIYFDSTARINSASLNSITVGTASYVSGSTSIITNLTASNISASSRIIATSFTGSLFGTSSWASNALTASFLPVGTYNITSSWSTNALTASSLVVGNSYTITNLTASNISASLTGSFGIVGIGTVNPAYKLDVVSPDVAVSGQPGIISRFSSGVDGRSLIRVINTSNNNTAQAVHAGISFVAYATSSNQPSTNTHEAQIMLSNGTTGGTNDLKFIAPQGMTFWVSSSNVIMTGSGYVNYGTQAIAITPGGNVGIGTTSATTKLHVSGSVTALDGRFISNVTSGTDKYFLDCYGTSTNQIFALYENSNTAYLNSYSSMAFRANQNGGSGGYFVFSGANVGIGTTIPGALLHVYGATPTIRVQGSSAASAKVDLVGTYTTWSLENQYVNGANNDMFRIYNSALSADAITINRATNNVGIGATNPAYLLDVSGSSRHGYRAADTHQFTGSVSVSGSLNATASWATNALTASSLVAANSYTITNLTASNISASLTGSFGMVGIGTTSPVGKLTVQGNIEVNYNSITADSSVRRSFLTAHATINRGANIAFGLLDGGSVPGGMTVYNTAAAAGAYNSQFIGFNTHEGGVNEGERMRITSLGNVGIGTTSPGALLEISSSTAASLLNVKGAGGNGLLFVSGSGFVGIGTSSPVTKLDVVGLNGSFPTGSGTIQSTGSIVRLRNGDSNLVLDIGGNGGNGNWLQATNRSDLSLTYPLLLNPNGGNVGIGTTSPDAILTIKSSSPGPYGIGTPDFAIAGNAGGNLTSLQIYRGANTGSYIGIDAFRSGISGTHLVLNAANNGNVGIGTTNPAYLLDVSGSSRHGYRTADNHYFTGSVNISGSLNATASWAQNVVSASYALTSSFATTAQTANALNASNNYQVNSIGVGIAGSGTAGRIGMNEAGIRSWSITPTGGRLVIEAGDGLGSVIFSCPVTSSNFVGPGTGLTGTAASLTAGTANALNTGNSYTISGLTNNSTLSQQGTLSMGSGYQILATTGTAPIPGISFVGDTNTGIYAPSADTLGFSISGSERVRIDSSGNVGVGSSSPSSKFEVLTSAVGLANQPNIIGNFRGDTDGRSLIRVDNTSTSAGAAALQAGISFVAYSNVSSQPSANKHEAQIILGSTGATSVTGGQTGTLQIVAPQDIAFNVSASNTIMTGSNYTTFGYNAMYIARSGNVGIGTTTPVAIVDIQGTNITTYGGSNTGSLGTIYLSGNDAYNSGTAGSGIYFRGKFDAAGTTRTTFGAISAIKENNTDGAFDGALTFFARSGSNAGIIPERMRISSVGNVGIGTTSPASLLHVGGQATAATATPTAIQMDNSYRNATGVNTALKFYLYRSGNESYGFGLNNGAGVEYHAGVTGNTTGNHAFYTDATEKMRIISNGNVGIGTTAPAAKLEISGSSNSALMNIKSAISGAILYVSGSGAVGIGTSNVGAFTLQVSGSFGATTKSFIIDHPTKAGKKLMYGSLESPYHGIRLTGRDTLVNGKCKVELPDYIYKLILHDSVNIQLTGIKCNKTLYVDDINIPENYFTIAYDKAIFESYKDYDFFWDFTAIRADVPELTTEL